MDELLIKQLEELNFSTMEAKVYISLVKNGPLNGSKIAKDLSSSRSSVYSALDNLTDRSIIFPAPGDTNIFRAENPDTLFTKLKNRYTQSADILKINMAKLNYKSENRDFINIKGLENIIAKSKEILLSAHKEVYINTCLDLQIFKEEFILLNKKGVKIIVFTYTDLDAHGLPIDLYFNRQDRAQTKMCNEVRLMIVTDLKTTLIASGVTDEAEITGTFTENPLLSSIVSEHIHHDIYLLKLKNRHNKNIIDEDILINTLLENR